MPGCSLYLSVSAVLVNAAPALRKGGQVSPRRFAKDRRVLDLINLWMSYSPIVGQYLA